jgi:hypothetical protein
MSPSHAAELLGKAVGHPTKIDVTIKHLAPETWFLTSLVDHLPGAGRGTGQVVSALPSLQLNLADTPSPLDDSGPNNNIDDETESDDYGSSGDKNDGCSSDVVYEFSSSGKRIRWSEEDDNRLRRWKEEGKPWDWICR